MKAKVKFGAQASARVLAAPSARSGIKLGGMFKFVCRGPDGEIKWIEEAHNEVADVGVNDALDVIFGAQAKRSWFVGLSDATPTHAVGDTMGSHVGWTEIYTQYSQGTRPAYSVAAASSKSVTNAASVATYSFTATATIGGAFVASDSTKNGAGGILYSGVAFTGGNRTVGNGDSVEVTYVQSGADDGV